MFKPKTSIIGAAALALGLSLSACAIKNLGELVEGYGATGPGSVQEFNQKDNDRVFFDTGRAVLSPTAKAALDAQAAWLSIYDRYTFTIEGHTDKRGVREYNIALGARRAQAVYDYLAARGVSASRMKIISYGEERPVAGCDNNSCWPQNRVAVTILNGLPGTVGSDTYQQSSLVDPPDALNVDGIWTSETGAKYSIEQKKRNVSAIYYAPNQEQIAAGVKSGDAAFTGRLTNKTLGATFYQHMTVTDVPACAAKPLMSSAISLVISDDGNTMEGDLLRVHVNDNCTVDKRWSQHLVLRRSV